MHRPRCSRGRPAAPPGRRNGAPVSGRVVPLGRVALCPLPPTRPRRGACRGAPGPAIRGLVGVAAPSREDSPEFADVLSRRALTFDAELAPEIFTELFAEVEVER